MTQEQLAKHAKLSRTSIVNIEKGGQQILLHTVVGIARALNVSVADLLPKVDSLDLALSDKPQSGVEWIRSSTKAIKG